jgi:hypothetical protein
MCYFTWAKLARPKDQRSTKPEQTPKIEPSVTANTKPEQTPKIEPSVTANTMGLYSSCQKLTNGQLAIKTTTRQFVPCSDGRWSKSVEMPPCFSKTFSSLKMRQHCCHLCLVSLLYGALLNSNLSTICLFFFQKP